MTLEPIFQAEALECLERLSHPSDPQAARREARRLRMAARAMGHPLEPLAHALERHFSHGEVPGETETGAGDLPPWDAQDDPLSAQARDLLERLHLPAALRDPFMLEWEQRLARLGQGLPPPEQALEWARLHSAVRAAGREVLEADLRRLERGEMPLSGDGARLGAALEAGQRKRAGEAASRALSQVPAVPEPAASGAPPEPAAAARSEQIRIPLSRLGTLLTETGELSGVRLRLEQRLEDLRELVQDERQRQRVARRTGAGGTEQGRLLSTLEGLAGRMAQDLAALHTLGGVLEGEVLSMRLMAVGTLFGPLERLVRDLAGQLGKRVRWQAEGADTELDRKLLEGVRDPLMHMLRNALDHGLETPERREAVGKPPQGTVHLSVRAVAQQVEFRLEDDGAGLDLERIRDKALERGLIVPGQILDPAALSELIFAPGFSTAAQVSDTSGRGVGMDVVRENVRALGGSVSVRSSEGQGTTFVLRVPLTLATVRVLLLRHMSGGAPSAQAQTLALPTPLVERVLRVPLEQTYSLEGHPTTRIGQEALPIVDLGALLGQPPAPPAALLSLVLLRRDERALLLRVDGLLGQSEVVVRPLGWPLGGSAHLQGAATLGDGSLVPILSDAEVFARGLAALRGVGRGWSSVAPVQAAPRLPILVVDDSITTRTLEVAILEAAGYSTRTAVHGRDALALLEREAVALVLSDVEMPEMDGFALTEAIRDHPTLSHLPIILVTSLGSAEHRSRGAEAGADAYIVKGEFEQGTLLEAVRRLI